MKAILLAAGKGTRICNEINNLPKSTLNIEGVPLIRRNIELLIKKNIEPIVCVGYNKEYIYKALDGLNVKYYTNHFYSVTNSIASLWFAKEELTEKILIINADVYFSEEILDLVINKEDTSFLVVDTGNTIEGDYFLKTKDGIIEKYGKDLKLEDRSCEYVGIGKINDDFIYEFKERLNNLIDKEKYDLWWEDTLYSFVGDKNINTLDIKGKFWREIDYLEDYKKIIKHVESNNR